MDDKVYRFIFDDLTKRLNNPESIYAIHNRKKFDAIPSDVSVVDEVLNGGLPEGRITEIFGPEASGKTTLTLHFIASAQKKGYCVYFIDAEHALDVDYASRVGVDIKQLFFCQPEHGEEALDTARAICESTQEASEKFGKPIKALIVIDSVPALVPKDAFEAYNDEKKEGFESSVGLALAARVLSKLLPPLVRIVSKSNATLVFINQERDNVGVTYGSPTTTPGGRALKFFASLRLKVQRIGYAQKGEEKYGIKTQMMPIKSKLFSIFGRRAEFIITSNGINQIASLVETLVAKEIIKKAGPWYSYGDKKFQGTSAVEEELTNNKEFFNQMMAAVAQKGGLSKPLELKMKPEVTEQPPSNPPPADKKIAGVVQGTVVLPTPGQVQMTPVGVQKVGG